MGLVRHNIADIMKSEMICDSTIMSVTHQHDSFYSRKHNK